MTKILLLFFINFTILFKISHAQCSNRCRPNAPPASTKPPTQPLPPTSPILERGKPECCSDTATVIFIPAPPTAPKITILDPKDVNIKPNIKPKPREVICLKEESFSVPSTSCSNLQPSTPTRTSLKPCLTGLPDLLDEFPTLLQIDRIGRLAESDNKKPVCESCASLLKKLPIFNFDQDLLHGFLAGIGL